MMGIRREIIVSAMPRLTFKEHGLHIYFTDLFFFLKKLYFSVFLKTHIGNCQPKNKAPNLHQGKA